MGFLSKILGTLSNAFTIGDGTTADKYIYADNGGANLPGFRRLNSSGVWEYSNDGTNWFGFTSGSDVFGNNYQTAVSLAKSTTTSATMQDKDTLTTGALTGTYRVGWMAVLDIGAANKEVAAQLYNVTDAVVVGVTQDYRPTQTTTKVFCGGFAEVVFTGAAKTFKIQFSSPDGSTTVGIQDARIELWRVS